MIVGFHTEEMNLKLLIPMYIPIFQDICEYCIFYKKCIKMSFSKKPKQYQIVLAQDLQLEEHSDFNLLDVGVPNVNISILFSERLIYQINIDNISNIPECQQITPYVK